jgi:hypothetical protein
MNCEGVAEFVSALFDGEKIPREAAKHIGVCEACRARLKEYAEIGVELRRVASLESDEVPVAGTWEQQHSAVASWWRRGFQTMRVPRFAFVFMLALIAALGSGLAVLKARPVRVLMLTVHPVNPQPGHTVRCALLIDDEKVSPCGFMVEAKSGTVGSFIRIVRRGGEHFELSVRTKFWPIPSGEDKSYSATLNFEDSQKLPETMYWFEPGQELEVEVPGFGTLLITGELRDHMPAILTSRDEQLDPEPNEIRIVSPVLLRDKERILDFEGASSASDEEGACVVMYAPQEGRYVLSLVRIEGAVEGDISQSRAHFKMNGKSYTLLTGAPIASRADRMWILHQPNYKPSDDMPGAEDDRWFTGSPKLEDLFPNRELGVPGARFAGVDGFAALEERLEPAEHSGPASVALCQFGVLGKSAMANTYQRALFSGLQLPTDGGLRIAGPSCYPGTLQCAWRINRQILSSNHELVPLAIEPNGAPFAAHA